MSCFTYLKSLNPIGKNFAVIQVFGWATYFLPESLPALKTILSWGGGGGGGRGLLFCYIWLAKKRGLNRILLE